MVDESNRDGLSIENKEDLIGLFICEDDATYRIEGIEDGILVTGEVGDRLLDSCPVEEGDVCIYPGCEGTINELELSAHELFCTDCGLHWIDRDGLWAEEYSEYYIGFTQDEVSPVLKRGES